MVLTPKNEGNNVEKPPGDQAGLRLGPRVPIGIGYGKKVPNGVSWLGLV